MRKVYEKSARCYYSRAGIKPRKISNYLHEAVCFI